VDEAHRLRFSNTRTTDDRAEFPTHLRLRLTSSTADAEAGARGAMANVEINLEG